MIASLVTTLVAACAGPFFEQTNIVELLSQAEEIVSMSGENSRTFDLHDGTFLTILWIAGNCLTQMNRQEQLKEEDK